MRHENRGDVDLYEHYAEAGLEAENSRRAELDESGLILDRDDLKAFHVKFTRIMPDDGKLAQSEAICAVIRDPQCWKLKLGIGAALQISGNDG